MSDLINDLISDGYTEMAENLKKYYRNAVVLSVKDMQGGYIPVGASKMGGFPDLPPEIEYSVKTEYTETRLRDS